MRDVPTTRDLFRLNDAEWVARLEQQAGIDHRALLEQLEAIRFAIDTLVCDDHVVLFWDQLLAIGDNPVVDALLASLHADDAGLEHSPLADAIWEEDDDALATLLDIDAATYARTPISYFASIFFGACEALGLPEDEPANGVTGRVLQAVWPGPPHPTVRYRPMPAGRERIFEDWLVGDLNVLGDAGYPVELADDRVRRQWHTRGGHIADVVCRLTRPAGELEPGDWLVIENKTVAADLPAVRQLNHYVESARNQLATDGQNVGGLLLADGASPRAMDALDALGYGYVSLVRLGYRHHLRRTAAFAPTDATGAETQATELTSSAVASPSPVPRALDSAVGRRPPTSRAPCKHSLD